MILNTVGDVIDANATAARLFQELGINGGSNASSKALDRAAVLKLLALGGSRFTMDKDSWAVIPRPGKAQLVIHAVNLETDLPSAPHTVLVLVDFDKRPTVNPVAIQKIFGLTPSEAKLAEHIVRGDSPAEVARANGVSVATVRSQLACLFDKTGTHRQAELVAVLTRASVLP